MTRTEQSLHDGARFLLRQGYNPYTLRTLYLATADQAEAKGRHDEAAEVRSALEEFKHPGEKA